MKNLLFLLTLTALLACSKDYENLDIESDVVVSAVQDENNKVTLSAETETIYEHTGHSIIFCQKSNKRNEFFVHFKKVKASDTGFAALSPAKCSVDLGELKNGEYLLTFKLNGKKTLGSISIINGNFEFNIPPGGNVKV